MDDMGLPPGAGALAFIDIDLMQKRVHGHVKQGAKFGHTKIQGKSVLVRGQNALAATIGTPIAAPVIAATRLRGGNAASARGAASLAVPAIGTARPCGCTGIIIFRTDSACYDASVTGAIGSHAPVLRHRPHELQRPRGDRRQRRGRSDRHPVPASGPGRPAGPPIPDAKVAETRYTAFASKQGKAVTAHLIVRRVRDQNKKAAQGQDELFPAWRDHAVFTDSPFELAQAEGSTARPRHCGAGLRRSHQQPARPPAIY